MVYSDCIVDTYLRVGVVLLVGGLIEGDGIVCSNNVCLV